MYPAKLWLTPGGCVVSQEAEIASPGGEGGTFAYSIQFQEFGVEPGKSSGSLKVKTRVRVAVGGKGGATVTAVPEPAGPEPIMSLGCAFLPWPPAL